MVKLIPSASWFSRIVTTRVLLLDRCTILIVSNLIVSHFRLYSDGVSIKVFGNMIWVFGVLIGDLFVCLLIQISQFQSQLMMLLLAFMVSQVDQVDSYYRLGFHE